MQSRMIYKIAIIIFSFFTLWWLSAHFLYPFRIIDSNIYNLLIQYYGSTYGILALYGSVIGFYASSKWGGFHSLVGRAIIFLSMGLLAQFLGQLFYTYYVYVLHIEVPYPSIGDVAYFGSIPLYILGTFLFAKASGFYIGLRSFTNKIHAVIIPFFMLITSYFFFLQDYQFDWNNPLTIFFDFGYPLGQATYLSFAILAYLLSRNTLGGLMKKKVVIVIIALALQYLADYTFLFQVSRGVWTAGGINELMYLLAYFAMTIGLLQLDMTKDNFPFKST